MDKQRCAWANSSGELRRYHDEEYGFPVDNDIAYFERLILEIFQAGLSWQTVLKKRESFGKAFDGFDFHKVANYQEDDFQRLVNNPQIIRNKLKIRATIHNAKIFRDIVEEYGCFAKFIETLPLEDREATTKVFKKTFKFMGPIIVEEFLMGTGHWLVQHEPWCFLHPDSEI